MPQTFAGSSPGAASAPRQDSVEPQAPQTAAREHRVARSASARGTAAPVTTKIRSAGGAASSPSSTTRDQVGEERRRRLDEGAVPLAQRAGAAHRLPDVLEDLRRAEHERQPHPVEEAGLVGERGRDEQIGRRAPGRGARPPSPRRG